MPTTPTIPTTPTPPAAPVFTSTPVTQAAEATPYSYQLTATGTGVGFSLTSAPTGATLNGSTISWTPTSAQSRVPNNFTATATVSGAPSSATQSWTVTPSGIIRISRVDTVWKQSGSTNTPFDWTSISSNVAALVPQPDGSFQSLSGTAGANGSFQIPNVPAGYYWLKLGPRDTYWTSSSTFDMGSDVFIPVANPAAPTASTTNISINFTSLDATATPSLFRLDTPEQAGLFYQDSINAGSTTATGGLVITGNLDFSVIKNAFVRQYKSVTLGSMNGYVLGPELTLSNLSLTSGGLNTLSGALNPSVPASINLSVKGSAWLPLSDHIAPTAPAAVGSGFYLSALPYIAADGPNMSPSTPIDLIWTNTNSTSIFYAPSSCPQNPPFTADVNVGAVQYSDPFPAAWRRVFSVCQNASVTVPVPGGSPQTINLINIQTTSPPTATVTPLISAVQNPKINGTNLFTASTVSSTAPVTLTWDPPAVGAPVGYSVSIMSPATSPVPIELLFATTLSTAKTSVAVPPNLLSSGKTYFFVITSVVDGKSNMETSPHRSSLPTASAQLISAPITIQ